MQKNKTKLVLQTYWQHVWRYPVQLISTVTLVPLATLINQFLPPLILANVLSRLSHGQFNGHDVWGSFGTSLVEYGVLMVLGGVIIWRLIDWASWSLEFHVQKDIAERVFDHLQAQSPDFHANNFGGSLVSQTNKLMGSYIRFADTTIFQTLPLTSALIFTLIILAPRAPLYTVVLLVVAGTFIVTSTFVTRKTRRMSTLQAAAESEQTGYLADAITNVMAIKSFAGGAYEKQRFAKATNKTYRRANDMKDAFQSQLIYFSIFTSGLSTLALVMAVVSVMVFKANVSTVYLIFTYTTFLVGQLLSFGNNVLRNYTRSIGDASDMAAILALTPEILDPEEPEESHIKRGEITLKDVYFTHKGNGEALFEGLNLKLKAGEKVGLVGHSGSGKTTLSRILLRFSDIQKGEILIDGQNIAHLRQDDLRRSIAYVPQEPIMFHRSLADNIRYGQLDAEDKTVKAVAKMAHADEFIAQLPDGYETLVGERGIKLSGGQRQRIAIARAMLKNAPILLLDEATSALDSESEALIQDALWKLMENRTAIVIAHRLSTIQAMDRIVVLDEGKIVEQGSHKELVNKGGPYAKLWQRQSGGFMEDE